MDRSTAAWHVRDSGRGRRHPEHHRGTRRAGGIRGRAGGAAARSRDARPGRGTSPRDRVARRRGRPEPPDAHGRADPPLRSGRRRTTRTSPQTLERYFTHSLRIWYLRARPRPRPWATRSTTRRSCSRRSSTGAVLTPARSCTSMCSVFQRETWTAFSLPLSPPGLCHTCRARRSRRVLGQVADGRAAVGLEVSCHGEEDLRGGQACRPRPCAGGAPAAPATRRSWTGCTCPDCPRRARR